MAEIGQVGGAGLQRAEETAVGLTGGPAQKALAMLAAMRARMNFASDLARNQRFKLAPNVASTQKRPDYAATPEAVLVHVLERLSPVQHPADFGFSAPYRVACRRVVVGF